MAKFALKKGFPRLIDEWHFNGNQEHSLTIPSLRAASQVQLREIVN
jgi:hypothetical protein